MKYSMHITNNIISYQPNQIQAYILSFYASVVQKCKNSHTGASYESMVRSEKQSNSTNLT